MVKVVLTDIEGTTSSISFVKEVLFPYAAQALPGFLAQHWEDAAVAAEVDQVIALSPDTERNPDAVNATLQQWIAEDRKATPLKALQGMIWRQGYEQECYRAHLYDDVAPALKAWHQSGLRLFVYSSGSVDAQKLFFCFSEAGDLRPLFEGYFDTRVGHKQEVESYRAIATLVGEPAEQILFLSDVCAELDAAAAAGMNTTQLVREEGMITGAHPVATSFAEIKPV